MGMGCTPWMTSSPSLWLFLVLRHTRPHYRGLPLILKGAKRAVALVAVDRDALRWTQGWVHFGRSPIAL